MIKPQKKMRFKKDIDAEMEDIVGWTSLNTGFSMEEIRSREDYTDLNNARALAIYLCKFVAGASLKEMGAYFSNRDTSTISYIVKQAKNYNDTEKEFNDLLRKMERVLRPPKGMNYSIELGKNLEALND